MPVPEKRRSSNSPDSPPHRNVSAHTSFHLYACLLCGMAFEKGSAVIAASREKTLAKAQSGRNFTPIRLAQT